MARYQNSTKCINDQTSEIFLCPAGMPGMKMIKLSLEGATSLFSLNLQIRLLDPGVALRIAYVEAFPLREY